MLSMPFVYYTIRLEERKIGEVSGTIALLKEHKKALNLLLEYQTRISIKDTEELQELIKTTFDIVMKVPRKKIS